MMAETIAGVVIPDTHLVREATEMVRTVTDELLYHHSRRVYLWGALQGARRGLVPDAELLYIGAMFHDLGLTAEHGSSDQRFELDSAAESSMEALKEAVVSSGAIRSIVYKCGRPVHFCVDSSIHGYGAILLQIGESEERVPSRFMSGTWNNRERNYSQAKLELFGLFRALYEARIYLVGLEHFFVEVDASYIKGMINNPDVQPSATINQWIAAILLFNLEIRHIPTVAPQMGPFEVLVCMTHPGDPQVNPRWL